MRSYSLQSYKDFRTLLRATEIQVQEQLSLVPDFRPLEIIQKQLEAVIAWTAPGEQPTKEQKDLISFGLITARELDDSADPTIQDLANRLHALSAYFDRTY
jgi:hypothetical protein